jgi:hypothetical protein
MLPGRGTRRIAGREVRCLELSQHVIKVLVLPLLAFFLVLWHSACMHKA